MLKWMYETIYNAVADFFEKMGSMGADIFALDWIQATIKLFTLFGWALFIAGVVVAIFDVAIEYQHGRADIKTTSVNILKGFFACSLIGVVPVELYKFCISLQNNLFPRFIGAVCRRTVHRSGGTKHQRTAGQLFAVATQVNFNLFNILALIAFAYCVVKILFPKHQARRHPACADGGGRAVYVFSSPRLLGRFQSMVQTGGGYLFNCVYADQFTVPRSADLPRQYAAGAWRYAGGKRSSQDSPAVWSG
mgnify:CR=1 FL=1